MYYATTIIFVVTQEWRASKNCRDEYLWFEERNYREPNALKGISLVIEDDALGSDIRVPVYPLPRTAVVRGKRKWELSADRRQPEPGKRAVQPLVTRPWSVKDRIEQFELMRKELTGHLKDHWWIDDGPLNELLAMI
jgi:hypothetical protein